MAVASFLDRVLQVSLVAFALFVPFSIAGMNIALGFGALAWVVRLALPGRDERRLPALRDPLLAASVLLFLSALPSALASENSARALKDLSSYWQLAIVFFVACNVGAVRARQAAFWTLVASSSLACLVALVQRAGGLDLGVVRIGAEYRVGGTLYTMTFAGILYQLIVLNGSMALGRALPARRRMILVAAAALQTIAIVLTMTRGAWVALAGGLVAVALLERRRAVTLAAAACVVALAGFSLVNFHQQGRSIPELVRSGLDKDASTRVVLWDIAWDLFKRNPVAGVGMGDYSVEADKLLEGRRVTTTVDTHNVYLHILATRGLLGFVPFVIYWVVLLRSLLRARSRSALASLDRRYAAGAVAVTVAVLLGALTELNIDDSEVFMTFMFAAGLALAPSYARAPAGAFDPAQRPKNSSQRS